MFTSSSATSHRGFWEGVPVDFLINGPDYLEPHVSPNGVFLSYRSGGCLFLCQLKRGDDKEIRVESESICQLTTPSLALSTGTEYGGRTYCWSGDSTHIFFSSKGQLHRVSVEGGLPQQFPSISHAVAYAPAHSSYTDTLFFCLEDSQRIVLAAIKSPLHSDISGLLPYRLSEINATFTYDAAPHPSLNILAFYSWSRPYMVWNESAISLYKQEDGTQGLVEHVQNQPNVACFQPKFSPSGRYLSYISDHTGWLHLYVTQIVTTKSPQGAPPAATAQPQHLQISTGSYDIGFLSLWTTGASSYAWVDENTLVFVQNQQGNFILHRATLHQSSSTASPHVEVSLLNAPAKGVYSSLQSVRDGHHVICNFQDHKTRGDLVIVNVITGAVHMLFRSGLKTPGEIQRRFVEPQFISFPLANLSESPAISENYGLLYLPQEENEKEHRKAPMIVFAHGGPTGGVPNRYSDIYQYFASRGWAVFACNYRGSVGFGRKYRESLNGNWGVYDVEDCVAGAMHLVNKGLVDQRKMVIMGGSAGGFTTLLTLARNPRVFAAGVNMCGVSDLFMLDDETHLLERHYNYTLVGPLPESCQKYMDRSASHFASKIVDPILILQGSKDTVVPVNQAELIRDNVSGVVQYHLYEGEGHMFMGKPSVLTHALPLIQNFLKKHVLYK